MAFDYDIVKQHFAEKLAGDWLGKGRFESAVFHTAQWLYERAEAEGYARGREQAGDIHVVARKTEITCPCGGAMLPGIATAQTVTGTPDFPGDTSAVTVSPGGPGKLIACLKCSSCGHSVTIP